MHPKCCYPLAAFVLMVGAADVHFDVLVHDCPAILLESAGVWIDSVYIRQRQKGSAAHTVVLDHEKPNSLRCELEIMSVEQVSRTLTQSSS